MVRADFSIIVPTIYSIALSVVGCSESGQAFDIVEPNLGGAGGESGESSEPSEEATFECPTSTRGFASEVVSYEFGSGQSHGQDDLELSVLGGPEGGGCCAGSLQVASLGDGGHVVLGFGQRSIVDGEGPDFIVFENPFAVGGEDGDVFIELGQVSVSADGKEWFHFICEQSEPPYDGCAGRTPVLANTRSGMGDAFDIARSGGDGYDLKDLGLSKVSFVRVTDIADDGAVFDLDAISVINGECQ